MAVVGGGISGLTAAHALASRGTCDLALFEAGDRAGGAIRTIRRDGFLIEEGADSMIADKPWGVSLAERLGLAPRLIGTREAYRRSYVVRRGRLRRTPDGFHLLAPSRLWPLATSGIFSPAGLIRMALEPLVPPRQDDADESVGSFVRRRLGREALERLAQPMVAGIYGADPEDLSLRATLPRFARMEQEHGSLLRAMAAEASVRGASGARYGLLLSFDDGMQTLADALVGALPDGCLKLHCPVRRLHRDANGWRLYHDSAQSQKAERFDAVILALPAPRASRLLSDLDPALASELSAIPCASAATVGLAFEEAQIGHPMDGSGFVAPGHESSHLLGCTFVHRKYAGRASDGKALLRAYLGTETLMLTDAEMIARCHSELGRLLSIRGSPLFTHVARHPDSMPRYRVGHLERTSRIAAALRSHPGLALAGNYLSGVGIPDCIRTGEEAAVAV